MCRETGGEAAAVDAEGTKTEVVTQAQPMMGQAFVIENEFLAVNFSANGLLASMTNKQSGVSVDVTQSFYYYASSVGDKVSAQKSGAYIFRPKDSTLFPVSGPGTDGSATEVSVVRGSVVTEVRQQFGDWLTQTIRLPAVARHLELTHTVGAVPFHSSTVNHTEEQCVSWRQTTKCDPNGIRDPLDDKACDVPIPPGASGFCECFGGRRAAATGCGHLAFACKDACKFPEGREVVSRFKTSIESKSMVLTDSNGREMLNRTRDFRPSWKFEQTEPVAGNYYPINSAVAIRDEKVQLTLLVDRAVGAGSISDGELEVMVHRRVLEDDGRGVGEPLNETQHTVSYASAWSRGAHDGPGLVVRGTHRLSLEPPEHAAAQWRHLADRTYSPPQLIFRSGETEQEAVPNKSYVAPLHPNVQLMTLQALSAKSLLLRFSHQFGLYEDPLLSRPVEIDISAFFAPSKLSVVDVHEVSLTNSQTKSDILRRRSENSAWKTEEGAAGHATPPPHPWRQAAAATTTVTLGPLEIKTFVVTLA